MLLLICWPSCPQSLSCHPAPLLSWWRSWCRRECAGDYKNIFQPAAQETQHFQPPLVVCHPVLQHKLRSFIIALPARLQALTVPTSSLSPPAAAPPLMSSSVACTVCTLSTVPASPPASSPSVTLCAPLLNLTTCCRQRMTSKLGNCWRILALPSCLALGCTQVLTRHQGGCWLEFCSADQGKGFLFGCASSSIARVRAVSASSLQVETQSSDVECIDICLAQF